MLAASVLLAQSAKAKYKAWIELKDQLGLTTTYPIQLTDSTLHLYQPGTGVVNIPYAHIERIKIRKNNNIFWGALLGATVGLSLGAAMGGSTVPRFKDSWLASDPKEETRREYIGMGVGFVVGGLGGAYAGAHFSKKYEIQGNRLLFEQFREKFEAAKEK